MNIPEEIKQFTLSSESKALATNGEEGLNVVPVSVIKIKDDKIILLDFFMGKTVNNIKSNSSAALSVWTGLAGYQFKCNTEYIENGELFDSENDWSKNEFPERTLKGVLILSIEKIFDVAPGNAGVQLL